MKNVTLTSEQKRTLRKVYGHYTSIRKEEWNTREEVEFERKETKEAYAQDFPELVQAEITIDDLPEYIYSKNQLKFIKDAEEEGLDVDYSYSGRGMYGDQCPAVRCDSHNDLHTKANTQIDGMGLGIVIYAQY